MAASMIRIFYIIFNVYLCTHICFSQLELNDLLLEKRSESMWLVEFYAPWCGHCKKLEPIFHQVHLALRNSGVKVGKIDSTRYSSVATEFDVHGFPTIKFIHGERVYTYRGDRSQEDIIDFAIKAKGPAVRKLTSQGRFTETKGRHAQTVFFMFVGDEDSENDLYKKYSSMADSHIIQSYFYAGSKKALPSHVKIVKTPTVLVFKDETYYEFKESSPGVVTKGELEKWFNDERFSAFPKVMESGLNELSDSGKYLVLTIVNEDEDKQELCEKVKDMVSKIAKTKREKYHGSYQFLWMPDEQTANSITMSFLESPTIVVLETTSHQFYFLEKNSSNLSVTSIQQFLDDILAGKKDAYGGSGFLQKLKRVAFDFVTTALSIWQASRWLFLLMFGLPTVVISIVCYSLCCMENITDDSANSDDEDLDDETAEIQNEKEFTNEVTGHEKSE